LVRGTKCSERDGYSSVVISFLRLLYRRFKMDIGEAIEEYLLFKATHASLGLTST
jgi:hypothetical protein